MGPQGQKKVKRIEATVCYNILILATCCDCLMIRILSFLRPRSSDVYQQNVLFGSPFPLLITISYTTRDSMVK